MTNGCDKKDEGSACGCGGGSCCSGPGRWIWIVLVVAIAAVVIARNAKRGEPATAAAQPPPAASQAAATNAAPAARALPRLLDLGSTECIPCKTMAPILEELRKTYAGKLDVEFIDVWADTKAGEQYGINLIPTQIFYDASGKELFRHEGFFGREDILAKWKELGVDLGS
jgi:thioredoxin 1